MNINYILIGSVCVVLGAVLAKRNKFYRYSKDDMLYATKFKMFSGAILLVLNGLFIIINEIVNVVGY